MSDQADGLRQLVQARSGPTALAEPPEPARPPEAPSDGGYRRTAHVEAYYRSTRVF